MSNRDRREFIRNVTTATAGALVAGSGLMSMACGPRGNPNRREVMIGGRRIKTIDVHSHGFVRAVAPLLGNVEWGSIPMSAINGTRGGNRITPDFMVPERVAWMDEHGVDVQCVSVNPYWYHADRALAEKLIAVQNEALAADAAKFPGRFHPWASVALQFPDLAARQLEEGVTKYKMPGAAIACNIAGDELGSPKFDPFWAKCVELQVPLFLHPQAEGGQFNNRRWPPGMEERLDVNGSMGNQSIRRLPFRT